MAIPLGLSPIPEGLSPIPNQSIPEGLSPIPEQPIPAGLSPIPEGLSPIPEVPASVQDQEVSAAPFPVAGLGDRFGLNVREATLGTLMGSAANFAATKLAPATPTIDPNTGQPLPTISDQMLPMLKEEKYASEQIAPWYDEPGLGNKILHGGAALAGGLVGGMTSPENLIVPGAGRGLYEAAREGVPFLSREVGKKFAQEGALQGGSQMAANVGSQILDTFTGTREHLDPAEALAQGAFGAGLGVVMPGAGYVFGKLVNRIRGGPRVGPEAVPAPAPETRPIPPEAPAQEIVAPESAPLVPEQPPVVPEPVPVAPEPMPVVPEPAPLAAAPVPPPVEPSAPAATAVRPEPPAGVTLGDPPREAPSVVPAVDPRPPEGLRPLEPTAVDPRPPEGLRPIVSEPTTAPLSPEPPTASPAPTPEPPSLHPTSELPPVVATERPTLAPEPGKVQAAPPEPAAAPERGFSLEPVHPRTLRPRSDEPDLGQPGSHAFSIRDPAGETVGVVDTVWDPKTGNLHIADIQSNAGANSLGPAAVRQIREMLVARYPEVKTLSGQRITGAVSANRRSGAGPGREATQTVAPEPKPEAPSKSNAPGSEHPPETRVEDLTFDQFKRASERGMVGPAETYRAGAYEQLTGQPFTRIDRGKTIAREARPLADADAGMNYGYRVEDIARHQVHSEVLENRRGLDASGNPVQPTDAEVRAAYDKLQAQARAEPDRKPRTGPWPPEREPKPETPATSRPGTTSRDTAPPVDLAKLSPEDLHAELLRRSETATQAEDAVAKTKRGSEEERAASAATDAAEKAHAEARDAYQALPDREFTVTTRHYQGKTQKFTDHENTHTGKTAAEVMAAVKEGNEKYVKQTGRRAEIVGVREAKPEPKVQPEPAKTPEVKPEAAKPEAAKPEPEASRPGTPSRDAAPAREVKTSTGKRPVSDEEHAQLFGESNKARKALEQARKKPGTTQDKIDELTAKVRDAQKALDNAEGPPTRPTNIFGGPNTAGEVARAHEASVAEHTNLVNQRVHAEGGDVPEAPHPQGPARLMGGKDATLIQGPDSEGRDWIGTGSAMVRAGASPVTDKALLAAGKRGTSTTRTPNPKAIDSVTSGAGHDNPITWDRHVTTPDGHEVVIGTTHAGERIVLQKSAWDTLRHAMGEGGSMKTSGEKPTKGNTLTGKIVARNAEGDVVGVAMPRRIQAHEAHTMSTGEVRAPVAPETPRAPRAKRDSLRDQVIKREESIQRLESAGAPEEKIAAAREQASRLRDAADLPEQGDLRDFAKRKPPKSFPGAPLSREDLAHYSPGSSAYRDVFRDAGHDPDVAAQYPIKRQAEIVRQQVQDHFGFKNVSSDLSPVETRNHLSDLYHNGKSMAAATGMPYNAISLDGRVSLAIRKADLKEGTLGQYSPHNRTIQLMGRSNSFAHEWTHAWDHYLADALPKNPRAMKLLSETQTLRTARSFAPGSTAEGFAKVIGTIYGNRSAEALEILRLQHLATSTNPRVALKAAKELVAKENDFSRGVRQFGAKFGPKTEHYYHRPAEMLARAHEAFIADRIGNNGGDTRAVTKPGHVYASEGPDSIGERFEKLYPKADDRARIFEAFDQLHAAQRDESIAAFTGEAGKMPSNADTTNPRAWGAMADLKAAGDRPGIFRRELAAWRKPVAVMKDRLGFDASRPAAPPGHKRLDRGADAGRALTYTPRALMDVLIHRVPEGRAREAFQQISDHFAGAEGLRSPEQASRRHVGEVYEEDVKHNERSNINQMTDAFRLHDLENMTDAQAVQMHHVMTGGDTAGVPANIVKASAKLRVLLNAEHARHQIEANIDLGHSESAYFPRELDHHAIFGKPGDFGKDAKPVYEIVYDRDVKTREDMLAAHKELKTALPRDAEAKVGELRANEAALRKLGRDRAKLDPKDPNFATKAAEIDRDIKARETAGDKLHAEVEPHVRDAWATDAANDWQNRIVVGDPTEYETRGPAGRYTKHRVLPPEADALLRKWYISDPRAALPQYFRQSARRIAFAKRFGDGKLDALIQQAADGGAHGEDIRAMRGYVEAMTGRQKSGLPGPVQRGIDVTMAMGTMSLMTKAVFTSLAEPMNAIFRTGRLSSALTGYAGQIGDIIGTAGSKERKALANAMGLTTSAMYDSTVAHRMSAAYDDFPGLNKLQMAYFRRTGLTAMTNSQRRSMLVPARTALGEWARDLGGTNARLAREAAAQFRDLGIPDADHEALARYATGLGQRMPTGEELGEHGAHLWAQAARRMIDTIILDPMKVDKPLMSSNPTGRMMFGLMNYGYAFYHHVIERTFSRYAAQFSEAEGAGAKSMVVARSTMNALAGAGGLYGAALVSTIARERLFNGDTWDEQSKKGTLMDWLSDLAIQRTGVNGPLDPLIQAYNGLKYEKSVTGLFAGAQVGFLLHAVEKVVEGFARSSPHTNTSTYNALQGFYQGVLMPASVSALTALPGGPLTGPAASIAMMYATSKSASNLFARKLTGPKGSTEHDPNKELPDLPDLPDPDKKTKDHGGGSAGPVGLLDDIAVPVVRQLSKLPGPLKLAGVGAASLFGLSALHKEFNRYKDPPRERAR